MACLVDPTSSRIFGRHNHPKCTLIWVLGGAFHMKPSSRLHCYRWRLVERSLTPLFHATIPESCPETFQPASECFLEFRKKIFPATQDGVVGSCEVLRLGLQSRVRSDQRDCS